jgi:hypothetical protein
MYVGELIALLSKADPAAPIRFWVGDDVEAEILDIYDDDCDPDEPDISVGADSVNFDLDLLEELGPSDEDNRDLAADYDPTEYEE